LSVTGNKLPGIPDTASPRARPVDLVRKISRLIRMEGMIGEGDRVLVGFSGGVDSATLLFVLREIQRKMSFDLAVAHVNHLLRREESERDEAFVRETARSYGIPCFVERADVKAYSRSAGLSIQHAGRDIRYRFFTETADREACTKIALAHNLDDQVETFLLRLAKGTGIRGLSSIPPSREKIVRPFLTTYRSEIESYAAARSISFVTDSSNEKTVYERNYIRHKVIPLLCELNPAFREKVVSLLGDLTTINSFFDEKKHAFTEKNVRRTEGDIHVPVGPLMKLDEETFFRVVSDIVAGMAPVVPLREHIGLVRKVLSSRRPNLRLDLPEHVRVRKTYDKLTFTTKRPAAEITESFPLGEKRTRIAALGIDATVTVLKKPPSSYPKDNFTACFDLDKLGPRDRLAVRTFRQGDRFQPLGMDEPVKIKDFFISRKIPLESRRLVPLLVSGDVIVWVVGHRIDDRYKMDENTRSVLKVTVKKSCQPSSNCD
jgi:tRNA(Ile)-lysidine synthase